MKDKLDNINLKNPKQRILERFTDILIKRMEEMQASEWVREWIPAGGVGMPRNVSGRGYSGFNSFFLQLFTAVNGYEMPVFLTFNQAQKLGCGIKRGEKSIPVVYYDFIFKDREGNRIPEARYRELSDNEKKEYQVIPFLKSFNVFNVAQSNIQDIKPELIEKFRKAFVPKYTMDTCGMYQDEALDNLIFNGKWVCPILVKQADGAAYRPIMDEIIIPLKEQFNHEGYSQEEIYRAGQAFYETALHEMAHSTGHPSRLDRLPKNVAFGDKEYAQEELVAELSAAVICHSMGFSRHIEDNSAKYLNSWIKHLKEKPRFLESVMASVNKATDFMIDQIDRQNMLLNKESVLSKNSPAFADSSVTNSPIDNIVLTQRRDGTSAISAQYNAEKLLPVTVPASVAKTAEALVGDAKTTYLRQVALRFLDNQMKAIDKGLIKSHSMNMTA